MLRSRGGFKVSNRRKIGSAQKSVKFFPCRKVCRLNNIGKSTDYITFATALAQEFAITAAERDAKGGTAKNERDRIRSSGLLQLITPKEQLTSEQRGECAVAIATAKVLATRVGLNITSKMFEVMGARTTLEGSY